MATLNLVLDRRRARKDGTFPLVFRIRIGKKFSDIRTDFKLKPEEFDTKTSSIINDLMGNELLTELKKHYIKRLRIYIVNNVGKEDVKEARKFLVNKQPDQVTIREFWIDQIKQLETTKRYGGAKVYKTVLSVISQETDLNVQFDKFSYQELLSLEGKLFNRGITRNSINVYFRTLRAIFNQAIKHDILRYEQYPFRKYSFKKDKTSPRVLSQEELKKYFSLILSPDHPLYNSWLIGKLIFMLRGINITDLLLLSSNNIAGNRVIYKRAKTGKIYSIYKLDEVQNVFNKLPANNTLIGVIRDHELKNPSRLPDIIAMRRKVINNHLKKIGKLINTREPITTYVFRYSYANIAKQMGYSKDLIAEALGHEYGNSVTGIYLEQFDLSLVDEMNQQIIDRITQVNL